jgi:hypothetical protein
LLRACLPTATTKSEEDFVANFYLSNDAGASPLPVPHVPSNRVYVADVLQAAARRKPDATKRAIAAWAIAAYLHLCQSE